MAPGSEEMTALARLLKVADETARGDERMEPVAAQPGSTVSEVTGAIGTAKTTAPRLRPPNKTGGKALDHVRAHRHKAGGQREAP